MAPSHPIYSLSIPSLYDAIELECRIYHPASNTRDNIALIAHPYAPLGGSFDDPVVAAVRSALLQAGYIVGTFNFRGAAGSKGKTSWTGKPELADYASIEGFIICYLANLQEDPSLPSRPEDQSSSPSHVGSTGLELPQSSAKGLQPGGNRIICAGYSYGSIMARRAPTAQALVESFVRAEPGSLEEEIFLRAAHLATLHRERSLSEPDGRAGSSPVVLGTEGNAGGIDRIHRDHDHPTLTLQNIKESIDRFRDRRKALRSTEQPPHRDGPTTLHLLKQLSSLQTSYLLVSPPINVLSLTIVPSAWTFESKVGSFRYLAPLAAATSEANLVRNASLAIWGASDGLQSSVQLRKWAKNLELQKTSRFSSQEIPRAGHFWREPGVMQSLKKGITEWLVAI